MLVEETIDEGVLEADEIPGSVEDKLEVEDPVMAALEVIPEFVSVEDVAVADVELKVIPDIELRIIDDTVLRDPSILDPWELLMLDVDSVFVNVMTVEDELDITLGVEERPDEEPEGRPDIDGMLVDNPGPERTVDAVPMDDSSDPVRIDPEAMLVRPEEKSIEGILDVADAEEKTPVLSPNILEADSVGRILVDITTDSGVLEEGEEVAEIEAPVNDGLNDALESVSELVEVEGEILPELEPGVNPDADMAVIDEPELKDLLAPGELAVA